MKKIMVVMAAFFVASCTTKIVEQSTRMIDADQDGVFETRITSGVVTEEMAIIQASEATKQTEIEAKSREQIAKMQMMSNQNIDAQSLIMMQMFEGQQQIISSLTGGNKGYTSGTDYLVNQTNQRHETGRAALGGTIGLIKTGIQFGVGAIVADKLIDGLSRDTVTAGNNSTVSTGGDATFAPQDNRDLSDRSNVSSSNTESGPGDLFDSPEVAPLDPEIPEVAPEITPEL